MSTASAFAGALGLALLAGALAHAQPPASSPPSTPPAGADGGWTTQQDHAHMMAQLGITRLRPGPSGNPQAPNAANVRRGEGQPLPESP